jgi:quercetin dioxygenase-like cupin family protein
VTIVARGEQTSGAFTVLEFAVPPGEGPPLHVHTREDELVQVVDGDFRWKLGDELSPSAPGSFVFIPRGLPHGFQNVGDGPGRHRITFAPAGMERFFELQAELTEFDLDAFKHAAAEVGMDVVGPPLAESDPL